MKNMITISIKEKRIYVSDDLILYLSDFLNWIETEFPNGKIENGLAYYAYSRISGKNLLKLKGLLENLIALFDLGPTQFTLTGNYICSANRYEKIDFEKEKLIDTLENLCQLCDVAIKEDKVLIHEGI
jgi:hypothetical protein